MTESTDRVRALEEIDVTLDDMATQLADMQRCLEILTCAVVLAHRPNDAQTRANSLRLLERAAELRAAWPDRPGKVEVR